MTKVTKIEWVQNQDGSKGKTWNPMTGCTKISPGCKYCYAERLAKRLQAMEVKGYENGFELTLHEERLKHPFNRKKATTYFVNSMSDLFHEQVPDDFIEKVFHVIQQSPQHTFQILTKRAERMVDFFKTHHAPKNAWLGVSIEDRKYGLPRIDRLRQVDAQIRFLSMEPLLEELGELDLSGIHWVIVGGESGADARPMAHEWVTHIREQCQAAGVPLFIKQMGSDWARTHHSKSMKGNDMSEWSEDLRVRGYPLCEHQHGVLNFTTTGIDKDKP
jgi:protein gp37